MSVAQVVPEQFKLEISNFLGDIDLSGSEDLPEDDSLLVENTIMASVEQVESMGNGDGSSCGVLPQEKHGYCM